jgi:deoxyadenosine/deoxycytidine kinase
LNERYEAWIHDYDKKNLIILEVDDLNFVDNPEDLQKVVQVIENKLGKMKMDAK